ncbi:hypothetical protein [Rhizobium sp. SGZ-381]|uniref:hypothetical protein n=1 Tax=Rhizobium sp. SGZ-381 TaxID=3342800 RepID=UPI00367294B2
MVPINTAALARKMHRAADPMDEAARVVGAAVAVLAIHRGPQGALETLLSYAQALNEMRDVPATDA